MKLETIKHLKISDIIEFAPILKAKFTEAKPLIQAYQEKHSIQYADIQTVSRIVVEIGLYK